MQKYFLYFFFNVVTFYFNLDPVVLSGQLNFLSSAGRKMSTVVVYLLWPTGWRPSVEWWYVC